MTDFDNLVEALDEMPIHQLEQLNRLLEAVRRYMPREDLTPTEKKIREATIRRAVAQLRAGISDSELDLLIRQLRMR
jgi:hypothetical protein